MRLPRPDYIGTRKDEEERVRMTNDKPQNPNERRSQSPLVTMTVLLLRTRPSQDT